MDIEFKGILYDKYFKPFFKNKLALEDYINSYFRFIKIDKKFAFALVGYQYYISPNKVKKKDFYGDIIATLDNGEIIIIEAYSRFGVREYNKSYNYSTRTYSNQMNEGDKKYEKCKKVICLNLITSNFKRVNNDIINKYVEKNAITNTIINKNGIEMVLIRLDLCDKVNYNLNEERFIRWNKLIYAKNFEETENIGEGDEMMEQSIEYLKRYCNSNLNHGFKDFLEEEILEASEQGLEQGRKETLLETARNMLKNGISVDLVHKITGLTKKEIESLKD